MIFEALLLFVFCLSHATCQELNGVVPFKCSDESPPADTLLAYRGWPYRVTCSTATQLDVFYNWNLDTEPIHCIVVNGSGSVVFNQTTSFDGLFDDNNLGYLTPDVGGNSSLDYTLLFVDYKGARCFKMDFHLNVTELQQITCEEFADLEKRKINDNYGQHKDYSCEVSVEEYPKINTVDGVTYNWYHNCSSNLPNDTTPHVFNSEHKLEIPSLRFEHAGYFICSATYNGMTRFVYQHNVCVRYDITTNEVLLDCNANIIKQNVGESAELICTATFGQGHLKSKQIRISLRKDNTTDSKSIQQCTEKYSKQGNIGCSYDNPTDRCYFYTPSEEEQQIPTAAVQIRIVFENIEKEDYGKYVLISGRTGTTNNVNITFTLEANPIPRLLSQAAIAGICIGATLLFILVMIVMLYNAVYIRVYWRRYFGVYIIDDKKYGALLAYNFSNIELDKFAREQVQSSIPRIRELLETMGYRVYDDHRDEYINQCRAENIEATIEESHRIIVFLSSDFIKDGWSMLTLHKGFQEMINSRSRLIFILLPGIKEYLKQHSKNDDACRLVQKAIKLNYAIEFPKNLKSTRFRYFMKDAMPKLRLGSTSNIYSVSSHSDLSVISGKNVNYQRCFSNETDITVVDAGTGVQGEVLQMIEEQNHGTFDNAL